MMQSDPPVSQADAAGPWRRRLAGGAALLAVILAAAALVFWVASQWGGWAPDARLWLARGALAGTSLAASALAWRAGRWVDLPAGLAAACTGALLALVGQAYQTGADAWPLFLLWAGLSLPWLLLLRTVFPWLLCAALLNLALGLYLSSGAASWLDWDDSRTFLGLAALNACLLVLAEWAGARLDDPWRLARRLAAAALLWGLWMAGFPAALDMGAGPAPWLPVLSVAVLAALYWVYARRRRDLAVGALALLTGLGLVWLWLWPHADDMLTMLGLILLLLALGLAALAHVRRLWRAVSPARAPGEPWFLAGLRVGILGSVVLLLVAWVAAMADIETGAQALLLGVILLVPGLWLARRGRPGALAGQLGEVLAGVGLVLATGGALFLDTDRGLPALPLGAVLALGAAVFLASARQALRFAAALAVLAAVLWLTWPATPAGRGLLDAAPADWPQGLMLRLWWCQAGAVLAWTLSLRADRRPLWRPVAWALLLVAPPLAWLAAAFGGGYAWGLPLPDRLAGLAVALLPGLVLGAWLASRRALPPAACWTAAAVLSMAGLGWVDAPGVSVALTGFLLGRLAGHRLLSCLGAAIAPPGLYVFYLDPAVTLAHKAGSLGLAALWLLAAAGLAGRPALGAALGLAARRAPWRRPAGMLAAGALALAVAQIQIHHYRTILAEGRPVVLALAPVDPRSLMQGDYMDLDYAVRRQARDWLGERTSVRDALQASGRGWLLLRSDDRGIWQLAGVTAETPMAAADVVALAFRWRAGEMDWGARSWFFPEGQAERYARARYGVLRVAVDGTALLSGLLDEEQAPL